MVGSELVEDHRGLSLFCWLNCHFPKESKEADQLSGVYDGVKILALLVQAFPDFTAEKGLNISSNWMHILDILEAFFEVKVVEDKAVLVRFMEKSHVEVMVAILELVLCAVVQSFVKEEFIPKIMTLDDEIQAELMTCIQEKMEFVTNLSQCSNPEDQLLLILPEESSEEKEHDKENFLNKEDEQYNNAKMDSSNNSTPTTEVNEKSVIDPRHSPQYETNHSQSKMLLVENDALKDDNSHLLKEVERLQEELQDQKRMLSAQQQEWKEEKLRTEMAILQQKQEEHDKTLTTVASLENEVSRLRSNEELVEKQRLEIQELRDQLDLISSKAEGLKKMEAKIKLYQQKIESTHAIHEKSKRIEENNKELVEKMLEMEVKVKKMPTLIRKLEEAKTKETDARVRLSEVSATLAESSEQIIQLKAEKKEFMDKCAELTSLQSELKLRVASVNPADFTSINNDAGDNGLGELNPELSQKIERLEQENKRLNIQLGGETSVKIEELGEQIDDLNRLKCGFEKKWIDEKKIRVATQESLALSKENIDSLANTLSIRSGENDELKVEVKSLEQKLGELNESLNKQLRMSEEAAKSAHKAQSELQKELQEMKKDYSDLDSKKRHMEKANNVAMESLQVEFEKLEKLKSKEKAEMNQIQEEHVSKLQLLQKDLQSVQLHVSSLEDQLNQAKENCEIESRRVQECESHLRVSESQRSKLREQYVQSQAQVQLIVKQQQNQSANQRRRLVSQAQQQDLELALTNQLNTLQQEFDSVQRQVNQLQHEQEHCSCRFAKVELSKQTTDQETDKPVSDYNIQLDNQKKIYTDRIRQLESMKKQDDNKRREIIMLNSKLTQDYKLLFTRNKQQKDEIKQLTDEKNRLLLSEARRKKTSAPTISTKSNNKANVVRSRKRTSDHVTNPLKQKDVHETSSLQQKQSTTAVDDDNLKKRKTSRIEEENTGGDEEKFVEASEIFGNDGVVMSTEKEANEKSGPSPASKRRMSHFLTQRKALGNRSAILNAKFPVRNLNSTNQSNVAILKNESVVDDEEKASECNQQ